MHNIFLAVAHYTIRIFGANNELINVRVEKGICSQGKLNPSWKSQNYFGVVYGVY